MGQFITGIHHITALAGDPQKNINFYAGILGLRLIKKTVNFDAPEVYHLYYGNETGDPGTILTFFPYPDIAQGRKGKGQLTTTAFSVAKDALDYWMKRFDQFSIGYEGPTKRFDEKVLYFEDHEGLGLELVATDKDARKGFAGVIPEPYAIKGFYGVTLTEECFERTAGLLVEKMDHCRMVEAGNRFRYSASDKVGSFIDILCSPDSLKGYSGAGTIHHIAFATPNETSQLKVREKLHNFGMNITPVIDRLYFHSLYFREPGGVLFEIATMAPGFTVDEPLMELGEALKLPPQYESKRELITRELPTLHFNPQAFKD